MIQILIVDDEKLIRNGLSSIISEFGEEFSVIGEAANGIDALTMMESNIPDVVITDIKMPKMDGIEFIKILETQYPQVKKIVFSGFDEFHFVRESMKSGALDYLLKPLVESQLLELLCRIAKDIQSETEKTMQSINLGMKLNESMPLLKDQFLKELVSEGKYISENDLKGKFTYYNINFVPGSHFILIVKLDNYKYQLEKLGKEKSKINHYIVRNIAEESVNQLTSSFSYKEDFGVVIACSVHSNLFAEAAGQIAAEVFQNLSKYSKTRVSISIGLPVESILALKESYDSAIHTLTYGFYEEASSIMGMERLILPFHHPTPSLTEQLGKELKDCISLKDVQKVKPVLDHFCSLQKQNFIHPSDVIHIFVDIYMMFQIQNVRFQESVIEAYGENYSYIKKLDLFDTLDELKAYTAEFYIEVFTKMLVIASKKDRRIIQYVKEYIEMHYREDINLSQMAKISYLNSNYLSDLFKEQTGENFVDYVTNVRIDQSKILLKDLQVKTYKVGELVGYEDPAYFSKVFKKVVGVSPSEYRNLIK